MRTFAGCALIAFVSFAVSFAAESTAVAASAPMPNEAREALKTIVNKIAGSYSLLKGGKPEWTFSPVTIEKGKIDSIWLGMNRHEVFCVTIDPMIPTFTDWKIGNFVVWREEGKFWDAAEGDKETFLRLSCGNWKNPVGH